MGVMGDVEQNFQNCAVAREELIEFGQNISSDSGSSFIFLVGECYALFFLPDFAHKSVFCKYLQSTVVTSHKIYCSTIMYESRRKG